jgi:hypothetical protein
MEWMSQRQEVVCSGRCNETNKRKRTKELDIIRGKQKKERQQRSTVITST